MLFSDVKKTLFRYSDSWYCLTRQRLGGYFFTRVNWFKNNCGVCKMYRESCCVQKLIFCHI